MTSADRIAKIIEAAKAKGFLAEQEVIAIAFSDYAGGAAYRAAAATLRVAERKGLIIYTQVQIGPSFHYVYKAR